MDFGHPVNIIYSYDVQEALQFRHSILRQYTSEVRQPTPNFLIHQLKNTLCQIRLRCAQTQATSLLRSLRPVRPEFRRNARKHSVLPGLPGHTLSILTQRHVVPAPWLWFYSLLSYDGASFTLPLPRALTYFSCHLHRWLVRPSSESDVYRVD